VYKRITKIVNPTGLHARPASEFIKAAAKFDSYIGIRKSGSESEANAKSIVFLLSLGLSQETEVELSAEGEDEKAAVDTLVELLESGFGE